MEIKAVPQLFEGLFKVTHLWGRYEERNDREQKWQSGIKTQDILITRTALFRCAAMATSKDGYRTFANHYRVSASYAIQNESDYAFIILSRLAYLQTI